MGEVRGRAAEARVWPRQGRVGKMRRQLLLEQHALPCLRLALQRRPLGGQVRQELLQALLPQQGWPVGGSGVPQPGAGEQAEAAVLVLTGGGSGSAASVGELAACVRCFAATLAALLK